MRLQQICELCLKEPAWFLSHNYEQDIWYFTCCNCDEDVYFIDLAKIKDMDWISHIQKKGWDMSTFFPRFLYAQKNTKNVRKVP